MLLLASERTDGCVDLFIVLGDENIDRIKQYDHAEVDWANLPNPYRSARAGVIGVGFATAPEMQEIQRLVQAGKKEEAFQLVTRGFRYRPEMGDHDFGPTVLGEPTEGVKQ